MHKSTSRFAVLVAAVAALSMAAVPAHAQVDTTRRQQQDTAQKDTLPIDRWINGPTAIVLTSDQQVKFDSVRAEFEKEYKMIPTTMVDTSRSGGMSPASQRAELSNKFKSKVRDILTPYQQTAFDRNFAAEVAMSGGRRPPTTR